LLAYRTFRGEFGSFSVPLLLVSGTELESDEMQVYRKTYESLGLPFEGKPRRRLEVRAGQAVADEGNATRTHDWNRSIATTNSYWKQILSEDEVQFVQRLNAWIFEELEGISRRGHADGFAKRPLAV
jgi:hypothetical protein